MEGFSIILAIGSKAEQAVGRFLDESDRRGEFQPDDAEGGNSCSARPVVVSFVGDGGSFVRQWMLGGEFIQRFPLVKADYRTATGDLIPDVSRALAELLKREVEAALLLVGQRRLKPEKGVRLVVITDLDDVEKRWDSAIPAVVAFQAASILCQEAQSLIQSFGLVVLPIFMGGAVRKARPGTGTPDEKPASAFRIPGLESLHPAITAFLDPTRSFGCDIVEIHPVPILIEDRGMHGAYTPEALVEMVSIFLDLVVYGSLCSEQGNLFTPPSGTSWRILSFASRAIEFRSGVVRTQLAAALGTEILDQVLDATKSQEALSIPILEQITTGLELGATGPSSARDCSAAGRELEATYLAGFPLPDMDTLDQVQLQLWCSDFHRERTRRFMEAHRDDLFRKAWLKPRLAEVTRQSMEFQHAILSRIQSLESGEARLEGRVVTLSQMESHIARLREADETKADNLDLDVNMDVRPVDSGPFEEAQRGLERALEAIPETSRARTWSAAVAGLVALFLAPLMPLVADLIPVSMFSGSTGFLSRGIHGLFWAVHQILATPLHLVANFLLVLVVVRLFVRFRRIRTKHALGWHLRPDNGRLIQGVRHMTFSGPGSVASVLASELRRGRQLAERDALRARVAGWKSLETRLVQKRECLVWLRSKLSNHHAAEPVDGFIRQTLEPRQIVDPELKQGFVKEFLPQQYDDLVKRLKLLDGFARPEEFLNDWGFLKQVVACTMNVNLPRFPNIDTKRLRGLLEEVASGRINVPFTIPAGMSHRLHKESILYTKRQLTDAEMAVAKAAGWTDDVRLLPFRRVEPSDFGLFPFKWWILDLPSGGASVAESSPVHGSPAVQREEVA